MKGHIVRLTA